MLCFFSRKGDLSCTRAILVPVDGSPFGEHALPLAINLAVRAKAELHVVHVHTPLKMSYAEIRLYDETLEGQIRERSAPISRGWARSWRPFRDSWCGPCYAKAMS